MGLTATAAAISTLHVLCYLLSFLVYSSTFPLPGSMSLLEVQLGGDELAITGRVNT